MVGWKKFRTAVTAYVQLTPEHGGTTLTGGGTNVGAGSTGTGAVGVTRGGGS
jgi:hypothetical protein